MIAVFVADILGKVAWKYNASVRRFGDALFLTRIINGVFVIHLHYMVQMTKNEAITSKTHLLMESNILEPKMRRDFSHLLYII